MSEKKTFELRSKFQAKFEITLRNKNTDRYLIHDMIELHIFTQKEEWAHLGGYDTYQTTWEGTVQTLDRVLKRGVYSQYKIATTQIGILYTKLLDCTNLRIFIHDNSGCYEIKNGMKVRDGIHIHRSNNLFSFWYNGMFKK